MKKALVGAFVGALLVFGWQAISHMFMHHHDRAYKQIADQENVIQTLSSIFKEEGQYLVPRSNANSSQEEMQRFDESRKGKPWALVTYHTAANNDMAISALRSYSAAFVCVLIFIWLIGRDRDSFFTIFIKSLAFGFFAFTYVHYNNNIWLETPWEVIRPELLDILVAWGLCGLWLGMYLRRRQTTR